MTEAVTDLATTAPRLTGLVDFLSVLDAQRDLYANEDQLVQSQTSVTTNLIGLYRALGGRLESGANRSHEQVDTVNLAALRLDPKNI